MRGRGYTTLKGRQVQISLYLPPEQYWSLRAVTRKTGLSIQHLLRRALDQVVKEVRRGSFTDRGVQGDLVNEPAPRPKKGGRG